MLWGSQPERRLFFVFREMWCSIMTDQHLIQRGKQITDFQQAKLKMGDLRAQAGDISKRLLTISQALQAETFGNGGLDTLIGGLPTRDEILQIVSDIRTAQQTMAEVQKGMQQIGIEIS